MVPLFFEQWNADNSSTGKFVSESKFAEDPATFIPHILKRNCEALHALISKPDVEKKLLLRLKKKAATYSQDIVDGDNKDVNCKPNKIDVDGVVDLYESYIIPLTKEVEVRIFFDLVLTWWFLTDGFMIRSTISFVVLTDYLRRKLTSYLNRKQRIFKVVILGKRPKEQPMIYLKGRICQVEYTPASRTNCLIHFQRMNIYYFTKRQTQKKKEKKEVDIEWVL